MTSLLALSVDWTLNISNVLAYIGAAGAMGYALLRRLDKFESTLHHHAKTLAEHSEKIGTHEEKFDHALDRISDLAGQLQRLIGRSEIFFERRQTPRG